NTRARTLQFLASLPTALQKSEVVILAVGTPPMPDGSADLTSVEKVAELIAANLDTYKLIVSKSTVPVQTGHKIKETIQRYKKTDTAFDVASNPEFLREGKAVYDFFYPDRIVLGVESARAEKILRAIYATLKAPVIVTDINTAELIKHASNSFLATKISFINAVSRICDLSGADVKMVSQAMGLDKRIGKDFLDAGLGYGGFCFPKDVEAFAYISKKLGYDFELLRQVALINQDQRKYFVEKIKEHLWIVKDKLISVLGLSFKPDTDDMRFAPSIDIVNLLIKDGAQVCLYDPEAQDAARSIFKTGKVKFAKNPYEAVTKSDCACVLTEWDEFKSLDFKKVKSLMRYPLIADGRNMFDKAALTAQGFKYIGMGR
ncbi:MAG: UDP-glucose/GDP-mannose dehydrogenase family protein, partial [Candidatus Omnitrophota bacterium]